MACSSAAACSAKRFVGLSPHKTGAAVDYPLHVGNFQGSYLDLLFHPYTDEPLLIGILVLDKTTKS